MSYTPCVTIVCCYIGTGGCVRTSSASAASPAASPSTSSSTTLQYPTIASQRGRPQKRKQWLFDKVNHLVPFERQKPSERNHARLSRITGSQTATNAIRNGYVIETEDIILSNQSLSWYADDQSFHKLRPYFTDAAFAMLGSHIRDSDATETMCAACRTTSGDACGKRVKWIQCDSCLLWLHLNCTSVTRKPKRNWFRIECEWFAYHFQVDILGLVDRQ